MLGFWGERGVRATRHIDLNPNKMYRRRVGGGVRFPARAANDFFVGGSRYPTPGKDFSANYGGRSGCGYFLKVQ